MRRNRNVNDLISILLDSIQMRDDALETIGEQENELKCLFFPEVVRIGMLIV